jgi:hypothetical protein
MERVTLPAFKIPDERVKDMSAKMTKVFNAELKSTVYQLGGSQNPPKTIFKTNGKSSFPLRPSERNRLALTMSTEEVMNTNQYYEDETTKGKRRWKEIRHLWLVTRKIEHSRGSLENALWYYGNNGITCNHFVHAIMEEFGFSPDIDDMEAHLRWLYWSFNGGTADNADWREILATFRIVIFFRMIQDRPQDLLLAIFDIFAIGGTDPATVSKHPNEAWFITNVTDTLRTIFTVACETVYERDGMHEIVDKAILSNFDHIKKGLGQTKAQKVSAGIAAKKAEEEALIAAGGDPEEVKKDIEKRKRSRKNKNNKNDNITTSSDEVEEEKTGAQRLMDIKNKQFQNDSPYELEELLRKYDVRMYRKDFRNFLRIHNEVLVKKFQSYCWQRLPVDCRLQSLDEQQLDALRASDNIMYRFKLQQVSFDYLVSEFVCMHAAGHEVIMVHTNTTHLFSLQSSTPPPQTY